MSFSGARKIGSLISPLSLRELGMPADIARLPEISAAWSEAVGEKFAAHVRPIRYTGGKLMLRASSAVWVSKVRHSHETLAALLRQQPFFKDLAGLEVRVAPADRNTHKKSTRNPRTLSDDTRRLLEAVARDVADPELRAALTRLGRKSSR
jgi:hypothetical protein